MITMVAAILAEGARFLGGVDREPAAPTLLPDCSGSRTRMRARGHSNVTEMVASAARVGETVGVAANSRVTIAAHALAWLELAGRRGREVLTSEEVAASINTNAVIVRRSLGDLQRAGLVRARRGNGAGFSLGRPATEITLLDVWLAVSPEPLLALHHSEPNLECPVGRGIRPVLSDLYDEATETFQAALARWTVADILERILA
jgi:Rrf2 family protein